MRPWSSSRGAIQVPQLQLQLIKSSDTTNAMARPQNITDTVWITCRERQDAGHEERADHHLVGK